jgi:drug/metabolite transporter (DMT)-like permease
VKARPSFLTPTDALLLMMIVIWASNYSIVKIALREIPPLGFNSLRLALASLLFLASLAVSRAPRSPSGAKVRGLRHRWPRPSAVRQRPEP